MYAFCLSRLTRHQFNERHNVEPAHIAQARNDQDVRRCLAVEAGQSSLVNLRPADILGGTSQHADFSMQKPLLQNMHLASTGLSEQQMI